MHLYVNKFDVFLNRFIFWVCISTACQSIKHREQGTQSAFMWANTGSYMSLCILSLHLSSEDETHIWDATVVFTFLPQAVAFRIHSSAYCARSSILV